MKKLNEIQESSFYEAEIINLLAPYFSAEIPDPTWQTLMEKLARIVKRIQREARKCA